MVRAHELGAGISASHNFFPFSFPTKTSNPVARQEPAAQGVRQAAALLPQFSSTLSILAREAPQVGLSATQQRIDFLTTQISEAFSSPENLALALGGGVLLRSLRPSLISGEALFASSVSTLPARARLFRMSAAALGLVACGDGEDFHYMNYPHKDAGSPDMGVVDGGGDAFVNYTPTLEAEDELSLQPIISISGKEGENIGILLRGYDTDNDPLSYSLENPPIGSNVYTFHDSSYYGIFSWKPDYQQAGHYSLKFKVEDSHGASAYTNVQIDVANVIPDSDGDGWLDDKDCAPNDAHKFPLHDDPNFSTDNNIKNGEYTICPGTYRAVNLIGNKAIIHGENVTLEGNQVSMSAITQADNAGASTYTGFTIQNYQGGNGAIYVLNNNGNTFKNIKMINVDQGVHFHNSDNNLMQGLKMFDINDGIILAAGSLGYGSSDGNIIENCEIHSKALVQNKNNYGIDIIAGSSNTIRSNVVSKFGHNIMLGAISFAENASVKAYNNKLEGNTVVGAIYNGIFLLGTKGNILTNNNAKNNQTGIALNYCGADPGNTFTWNDFTGNGQSYLDQGNGGPPSCAGGYDVARITNPANHNLY